MRSLLCTLAILAISTVSSLQTSDNTVPPSCGTGVPNPHPINTDAPTFVKKVTNGKLFLAGQGNDTFQVLHVYGTPYEQGFANGEANKAALHQIWTPFLSYINGMINSHTNNDLPRWLLDLFDKYGVPALLDWSVDQTTPFTPQKYLDEMRGMADGANVSLKLIHRMNAFPELTKAACTVVGANGVATQSGKISHLRALDFPPKMPVRDYPQVTVYHTAGQPTVANVGWSVITGSLTGISDTMISIGEKVWEKKNVDGWRGQPWMFILRDVLLTKNITQALDTMQNANRTCAIHVGVGDSTTNTFRGVTMAKKAFDVYNSTSLVWTGHPEIKDVFYWNKHAQPSHAPCLGDLLNQYHGNLDAETLAMKVAAIGATGQMHCVTFDLNTKVAFIANARKTWADGGGHLNAYNRQFTQVNLTALWEVTME